MNERKFLIRNVKKARDLISGKLKVTQKNNSGDLVTNFDTEIEKFLIKKIRRTYPDFAIVSEEFNSEKKLTKNCFVIDPIDGTNNFARKIPIWGMQIACIKNGETVASVIYLPIFEELYSADKTGAYLNDDKIHVNDQNEFLGVYTIEQSIPRSFEIQQKNPNCRLFGSAAFSLSMVACGKMSAAMFKDSINPWDLIPGEYLVQKAGGVSFVSKHIRVCANNTNWANILTTPAPTTSLKQEKIKEEEPKIIEEEIIEIEKPEERSIKSTKKIAIEYETLDDKNPADEQEVKNKTEAVEEPDSQIQEVVSETKVTIEPDFEMEELEEILETYTSEIPEIENPEILKVGSEIAIEEKPIPKTQSKKPVKRPVVTKSTIRPNLTEARKRKIIM